MPDIGEHSISQLQTAETSEGHKLFRNFFTHLKVGKDEKTQGTTVKYELGESQVWEQNNGMLTVLAEVLE